jgi:L-ascorbate metabolism protein UlaG (beta-lactamase superfamily)
LDDGTHKLIIDPFLTGNPNAPVKAQDIKVDFVVVTHAHGDHLGDGIEIAKKNNATFIAINELANWASSHGVQAHNMHLGGAFIFPFGRLKFTVAHHSSTTNDGKYMGPPSGVIIDFGGMRIYHTGDTSLFSDMKLIGENDKPDMMLVCIGDNFTMGIDDAVKAVEFVNPETAIPMHYNTFPVIKADPNVFKEKVEKTGRKCIVMNFGEIRSF